MSLNTLDSKESLGCFQVPSQGRLQASNLAENLAHQKLLNSSGSDTFFSQQPSDELVTYESELYQRQTHDFYSFISGSDGDSHSGECVVPCPSAQPALGAEHGLGLSDGGKDSWGYLEF